MAATANIDTPERGGKIINLPVKAATTIYAGTLVAVDADGYARPAADAANLKVIGRADTYADNSGGAAGDVTVNVRRGIFKFANSASAAVDANDRGKACYVEDDQTVAETGGTNSIIAGIVIDVESDGVWVDTEAAAALQAARTDAAAQIAAIP